MEYITNKYAQSGSMNTHNIHSKFIDLLVRYHHSPFTIKHLKIALNNMEREKTMVFGSRIQAGSGTDEKSIRKAKRAGLDESKAKQNKKKTIFAFLEQGRRTENYDSYSS